MLRQDSAAGRLPLAPGFSCATTSCTWGIGTEAGLGLRRRLDTVPGMIYCHTKERGMGKAKIAITLDEKIVDRIDRLVEQETFSNRSQAIEIALREKLQRFDRTRLVRELTKIDVDQEKALAEEGIAAEVNQWPDF